MADITAEQMKQINEMNSEQVMKAMLAVLVEINENVKEVRDAIKYQNELGFTFDKEFPDKA